MTITYTYEILAVDEQARCMEVMYTSEGRQTQHIGARIPYEGEMLEEVIKMYAPVSFWIEQELNVVPPQVGAKGTIYPPVEEVTPPENTGTPASGQIPQVVL